MFNRTFTLAFVSTFMASGALAAPIAALSRLSYTHDYSISEGDLPPGVFLSLSPNLQIDRTVAVDLDRGDADVTDTPFVQIGDTNADAPIPFIDRRSLDERTPDDAHRATAAHDVEILTIAGPDGLPFSGVEQRVVDNVGLAALSSTDGAQDAKASADYELIRSFRITNEDLVARSFNIVGAFEANVAAQYDGDGGFARTSLVYGLDIDGDTGVSVALFPVAPYLTDIEDDGPNATVSEMLSIGEDGFQLSVGASALGVGGLAEALYEGQFRYVFGLTLQPGAVVTLRDRFAHTNATEYRVEDFAPIPLPASLPLLAAGLTGLGLLRRRGRL